MNRMKHLNLLMASFFICALTQAIAAEPPAAPSPQATAAAAADTAAASADSTKAAADAAAASADSAKVAADAAEKEAAAKADAEKKVMHARGYKQVVRGGQVLYCRREQKLGSMFDTEVCNTFDNIQLQLKYAQDSVQQMHGGAQGVPGH